MVRVESVLDVDLRRRVLALPLAFALAFLVAILFLGVRDLLVLLTLFSFLIAVAFPAVFLVEVVAAVVV